MIHVYTRPSCAYCPMVKKYLDSKGVQYEVHEAEGAEYQALADRYGFTVPLVYNGTDGMVGFNIARLKALAGL